MTIFAPVSADVSFADEEKRVLALWKKGDIFKRSVEARPVDKSYIFYDGPPFATGLPHYGHLVASTLKDIVPRYWTMRGFRVERRFGWDTHGLPIEMDVEKKLGLKGPSDVRAFGVGKFNEECRAGVLKYVDEWEKTITRVGRWVDFEDDYKTMDISFMESVWWVFSQLWEKGLVYQGHRVMPYSWRLSTPLSNFEAGLDYRDVDDPALTVKLPIDGKPGEHLLIWTTTPWTLPSNLAVAVHPDVEYSRVQTDDGAFWVGSALIKAVFGDKGTVTETKKGSELAGLQYQPLFPFFADRKAKGAFRVVTSEHVTVTDGTGLVHMAPAFGEDDYAVCKKNNIEVVDPVDAEGNFTAAVPAYAGRNVKEADKDIIKDLKAQHSIFKHTTIKHPYPYCWRSGTPLIYKTTPSWYVKVEQIRDQMVAANADVHWVPDFVGEARFNNWLKEARDWSISRSRFWGTPIPIWQADDGAVLCVGSVAELEALTGAKVDDLHPHKIDHLQITKDGKTYSRVKDVFDCWFESGSMPWAQVHYPFENKEKFDAAYPAQFIAEGLDQTRGWFYTLVVLGTALTGKSPFKNVIVNGLVLAKGHYKGKDEYVPQEFVDESHGKVVDKRDGAELKVVTEKMSKSKQNYTAPERIIDVFGADALRAYLINSPVVRGEPLRFEDDGVKDIVRTVLLPLQNALSFFITYANVDKWNPAVELARATPVSERPELDRWMLSVLQSLIAEINVQMEGYYLYKVIPPMLGFIDDLTNWYIRRSRRRFWKAGESSDKGSAYATLYEVLTTFAKVLAPVMPFVAESMYQRLVKDPGCAGADSVHLCDYPVVDEHRIDRSVEAAMHAVRDVVVLGRALREKHKLKTRQPLQTVTVVSHDDDVRSHLIRHAELVAEELNVKEVVVVRDDASLASLSFKANFKTLGKKLGGKMKAGAAVIEQLTREQWARLEDGGAVDVEGTPITKEDVLVTRTASGEVVLMTEGPLTVALDTKLSESLLDEGLVREVTSKLQQRRKDDGYGVTDRVHVRYFTASDRLGAVIAQFHLEISEEVLAKKLEASSTTDLGVALDVNGHTLQVVLERAS
ncbi:MAG: isoleucine--tRNA ligase [Deltaproteobacteria bacterium]|nr:isoleucine--tRNA ligase [Deltaproteobacteria bacterium]